MVDIIFTAPDGTEKTASDQDSVPDWAKDSMKRQSKPVLVYNDDAREHIRGGQEPVYTARLVYSKASEKRTKYGSIEDRGEDIELRNPEPDLSKLDEYAHLYAAQHIVNREWADDLPLPNNGLALFDYAILDLFEFFLKYEGLQPAEANVRPGILKTLFLMEAKGLDTQAHLSVFRNYLKYETQGIADKTGITDISHELKILKVFPEAEKLTDDQWTAIENAAKRAAFGAFRNGVIPTTTTLEKYNLLSIGVPKESPRRDKFDFHIDKGKLGREKQREALRNWIRLLADETLAPIDFGRDDPIWSKLDIFGLSAISALHNVGTESAPNILDWNYDRDRISGVGLARRYARERLTSDEGIDTKEEKKSMAEDLDSIEEQFADVHANTLRLAKEYGFFDEPQNVAIDTVKINTKQDHIADTINRPEHPINTVKAQ